MCVPEHAACPFPAGCAAGQARQGVQGRAQGTSSGGVSAGGPREAPALPRDAHWARWAIGDGMGRPGSGMSRREHAIHAIPGLTRPARPPGRSSCPALPVSIAGARFSNRKDAGRPRPVRSRAELGRGAGLVGRHWACRLPRVSLTPCAPPPRARAQGQAPGARACAAAQLPPRRRGRRRRQQVCHRPRHGGPGRCHAGQRAHGPRRPGEGEGGHGWQQQEQPEQLFGAVPGSSCGGQSKRQRPTAAAATCVSAPAGDGRRCSRCKLGAA